MIVTEYHLERFGFTLAAAALEIEELVTRKDFTFEDKDDPTYPQKDGFVRIKIWVNEQAYINGKEPILVEEKPMVLDYTTKESYHQSVLQGYIDSKQDI